MSLLPAVSVFVFVSTGTEHCILHTSTQGNFSLSRICIVPILGAFSDLDHCVVNWSEKKENIKQENHLNRIVRTKLNVRISMNHKTVKTKKDRANNDS